MKKPHVSWFITGTALVALAGGVFWALFVVPQQGANTGRGLQNFPRPNPPPHERSNLDVIAADMKWGKIAFNHPKTMKLDETRTIRLILSPTDTEAELRKAIKQTDSISVNRIQWSKRMEADLVSDGFKVTPITPKQQGVTTRGGARWEWQIKALDGGPQTLHLSLDALLKVDGEITPAAVQVFDDDIEVQVSLPQRVKKFVDANPNLQWIWTAFILPFLAYFWNKRKKRNEADAAPAGDATLVDKAAPEGQVAPADDVHPAAKP